MDKGHAVAVALDSPREGIPLVRDPKKPAPRYWKLPGGRGDASETAEEVAIREIQEELGLSLQTNQLRKLHQEDRESHIFTLFQVTLTSLQGINQVGNEGEEIRIFSREQICQMWPEFFPPHKRLLRQFHLL